MKYQAALNIAMPILRIQLNLQMRLLSVMIILNEEFLTQCVHSVYYKILWKHLGSEKNAGKEISNTM